MKDLSRSEIEERIDEWVFKKRNREILKRRLLDGITYERIAEEFGMSTRQIKNIVYRSETIVFSHVK